ncbi:MAG: SUF system NifU family Fe-S cluster assembly protein [bacterium]|nr:SUF system NifU family Fe-S cluster assembly protein [bacterium]
MDLKTLYRDVILDHYKKPRNAEALATPTVEARCKNPSCGDRITLQLHLVGDMLDGVGFIGSGCAISQASASMMTQAIKGKTVGDAQATLREFRHMIVDSAEQPDKEVLGDLLTLQGISKLHARVKCAMCGWSALDAALSEQGTNCVEVDLAEDQSMPDSSGSPGSV